MNSGPRRELKQTPHRPHQRQEIPARRHLHLEQQPLQIVLQYHINHLPVIRLKQPAAPQHPVLEDADNPQQAVRIEHRKATPARVHKGHRQRGLGRRGRPHVQRRGLLDAPHVDAADRGVRRRRGEDVLADDREPLAVARKHRPNAAREADAEALRGGRLVRKLALEKLPRRVARRDPPVPVREHKVRRLLPRPRIERDIRALKLHPTRQ
eukprot:CAMPEP_0184731542 /NCGR_PEP_ID=MMETSP0314-20130426/51239_1 /TAXON_ID=38298 /ORGANISM="Rhodella maculata, Strain CCMP 736" /LENGTH=209 /DNA_ID=CAMNT_0027197955 /DNA_START=306 /DNA_END=932 /DNA_ORIENTATION=-